jgi:hypothetical protein
LQITAFWDSAPSTVIEFDRGFTGAHCFHHQDETSFNFYETTRIKQYPKRLSSSCCPPWESDVSKLPSCTAAARDKSGERKRAEDEEKKKERMRRMRGKQMAPFKICYHFLLTPRTRVQAMWFFLNATTWTVVRLSLVSFWLTRPATVGLVDIHSTDYVVTVASRSMLRNTFLTAVCRLLPSQKERGSRIRLTSTSDLLHHRTLHFPKQKKITIFLELQTWIFTHLALFNHSTKS